jgi:hypothetical protein
MICNGRARFNEFRVNAEIGDHSRLPYPIDRYKGSNRGVPSSSLRCTSCALFLLASYGRYTVTHKQ